MDSLPLILYGTMAVSSGLLALLFPETKNTKMPDTVEDAENFGRRPSRKSRSPEDPSSGTDLQDKTLDTSNLQV